MPRIIDFVRNKNKADNGSDSDGGSDSNKDNDNGATNLTIEDKALDVDVDVDMDPDKQRSDKSLEVEVEPSPDADADTDADADASSTVATETKIATATPAAESVAPNLNASELGKEEITLEWRVSEKELSATEQQEQEELEKMQEQQQQQQQEEQQERSTSKGTGTSTGKASIQLHQQANPNKAKFVEHLIECSSISATKTPMTRISCHMEDTISNHPALLITASLTTILCLYMLCRKRLRRIRQWNRSRMYGLPNHSTGSNLDQGEYAALAVYDELLEDFDRDELSSAYTSGKSGNGDDSDDDSIGTIVSQWSDSGTRRRVTHKIELTAFNDGHLSLSEING